MCISSRVYMNATEVDSGLLFFRESAETSRKRAEDELHLTFSKPALSLEKPTPTAYRRIHVNTTSDKLVAFLSSGRTSLFVET